MADLTVQSNSDLNRLAEIKAKGGLLDPLDEQRLRDHQLRRLRRLWLKDQCLSAREPLMPTPKSTYFSQTWRSRLAAKEEAFWSRHLKFREVCQYLYHGKDFHQVPILMFYQTQRLLRNMVTYLILPAIPLAYFLKYGELNIPGAALETNPPIYPGDDYITVRRGDVIFDRRTGNYRLAKDKDEWQRVLIC